MQARKQVSKHAGKQASMQARKPASMQASKPASMQASKQAIRGHSVGAMPCRGLLRKAFRELERDSEPER